MVKRLFVSIAEATILPSSIAKQVEFSNVTVGIRQQDLTSTVSLSKQPPNVSVTVTIYSVTPCAGVEVGFCIVALFKVLAKFQLKEKL